MKASDLFVKCLEKEGVTHIFGVPGEENLDMLQSLKDSNIEVILTRNEQSAVFMAATYGRYTGKPGIAIATLGPGATNMVTGIGYAQLNGLPVIVITGQKPIKKSKQGDFQVIDVVKMMEPITKMTVQLKDAARITTTIRQAFKTAISERPGAVHIEFPEDIAEEQAPEEYLPIEPEIPRRPIADFKAVGKLLVELENAKHPIILIGAGANRKRVSKYLTKCIEKYNIPFFESQMGKGVVDESLPQYVGTAALSTGDSVHKVIDKADLIIAVGHDVIEKPTHFITEGEKKTIHINFYEAKVDDVYSPYLEVIGDLGNTFWKVYESELDTSNWDHNEMFEIAREEFKKSKQNIEKEIQESKGSNDSKLQSRQLVKELRESLQKDDILALDNGWYKIFVARNYTTYFPNTLLLDNTFATMGAGYSTGIVAKMLNPNNNVVVVTGDGGLVMNLGDLETVVRQNLDIVIVVLNNSAYGMIQVKQNLGGFDKYSLDLHNPNFVKLAESFGAIGMRVEKADDFKSTLNKAMNTKGVVIVDVAFEYKNSIVD